jgi:hypothetical protein
MMGKSIMGESSQGRLKDDVRKILCNEVSLSYRESYNHMVQVAFAFLSRLNTEENLQYYQPGPSERPSRVPMRPTNVTRGHSQDQPRAFGISSVQNIRWGPEACRFMFGSPTYFGTGAQNQLLWISLRIVCSVSDIAQTEGLTKQTMEYSLLTGQRSAIHWRRREVVVFGGFPGKADAPATYLTLKSDRTPQPLILLSHLHFYIDGDNFSPILIKISLETNYRIFDEAVRDSPKGDIGLQKEQG